MRANLLFVLSLGVVAACGDDGTASVPDGGPSPVDAAPDAPPPDRSARVMVKSGSAQIPVPNVDVLVHDGAGNLVGEALTGYDGRAIIAIDGAVMVTVARVESGTY